ncbi:MAG: iron-sulfur cluster repair di-iron protein [Acidobacteriales bacterium]|nr:iron-sulfur cluster repair di-iron protein [Terriglobales bacterium]
MSVATQKTIRDIAVENPATIRVFERFGIDYCCGGRKSLETACQELQLDPEQVREKLAEATRLPGETDLNDWSGAAMAKVIQHIVRRHHAFVRGESPRLRELAAKVRSRHEAKHPELREVQTLVDLLADDMSAHMMKEEQILFPFIARMEHELSAGQPMPPSIFGTVANPVRMMIGEHESAGAILAELRKITDGFQPPEDACPSFRGLYAGIADFEKDLHLHVHLENNILFPRAMAMEEAGGGARPATMPGLACGAV